MKVVITGDTGRIGRYHVPRVPVRASRTESVPRPGSRLKVDTGGVAGHAAPRGRTDA